MSKDEWQSAVPEGFPVQMTFLLAAASKKLNQKTAKGKKV